MISRKQVAQGLIDQDQIVAEINEPPRGHKAQGPFHEWGANLPPTYPVSFSTFQNCVEWKGWPFPYVALIGWFQASYLQRWPCYYHPNLTNSLSYIAPQSVSMEEEHSTWYVQSLWITRKTASFL